MHAKRPRRHICLPRYRSPHRTLEYTLSNFLSINFSKVFFAFLYIMRIPAGPTIASLNLKSARMGKD